ncbi:MAG: indole-3-glycerol phosphate synthase TrpC [Dehalococcoidia bacterium]|tara:strand:- start:1292 stop:2089 length:798 start_codon:yes stop_codon:yes gene_type:complete
MIKSNSPNILKEIVDAKKLRLEEQKKTLSLFDLEQTIKASDYPLNFSGNLMSNQIQIIAEIKKGSPSKGDFNLQLSVTDLAEIYSANGASAISVLTNEDHFLGDINDLKLAHEVAYKNRIPVLRKEFIFDPYQIYESRAYGADAILLIVAMLDHSHLTELMEISKSLWVQNLVEVHDENELQIALECGAEIIGINNRDLRTFNTTLETTKNLANMVPRETILVSESGFKNKLEIDSVKSYGVNAVLIGESLVVSDNPAEKLRDLL